MKGRIAITPRSMSQEAHPDLAPLTGRGYELIFPSPGRQPSEAELFDQLPGCVGYLAGVEPVSRRVIEASASLRVISRNGVGIDNIDVAAAAERGIAIERALGANTRGVAELALTLMLCGVRHVAWSDKVLSAGEWRRRKGREIQGRTIGIVGCGAIGRALAELCLAIGMKAVGYDPFLDTNSPVNANLRMVSLQELFAVSDAISLHCPPADKALIDDTALAAMRPSVVIVNTARAELVDDAAMLDALDSGKVSAFATDVFHAEPPSMTQLLRHEHTILSPHAGGFTDESVERATRIAVGNLLRRLDAA